MANRTTILPAEWKKQTVIQKDIQEKNTSMKLLVTGRLLMLLNRQR